MKCPSCGVLTKAYWVTGYGVGKRYYKCPNCGEHWDSESIKQENGLEADTVGRASL